MKTALASLTTVPCLLAQEERGRPGWAGKSRSLACGPGAGAGVWRKTVTGWGSEVGGRGSEGGERIGESGGLGASADGFLEKDNQIIRKSDNQIIRCLTLHRVWYYVVGDPPSRWSGPWGPGGGWSPPCTQCATPGGQEAGHGCPPLLHPPPWLSRWEKQMQGNVPVEIWTVWCSPELAEGCSWSSRGLHVSED